MNLLRAGAEKQFLVFLCLYVRLFGDGFIRKCYRIQRSKMAAEYEDGGTSG